MIGRQTLNHTLSQSPSDNTVLQVSSAHGSLKLTFSSSKLNAAQLLSSAYAQSKDRNVS